MNEILLKKYIKNQQKISDIEEVIKIANKLKEYLETDSVFKELKSLNVKHTESIKIQNVFIEFTKQLGFESEKIGLFKDYKTSSSST